jgi:hypothetical protein
MPADPTTPARAWTFRVRRGPDDEVIVSIAGADHVMTERQAETLGNMLRDCCQGAYEDSGSIKP